MSRPRRRRPPLGSAYLGSVRLARPAARVDLYGRDGEHVDPLAAARESARRSGCRCDVEVELAGGDELGVLRVVCRHDSWCPLLRGREDVN